MRWQWNFLISKNITWNEYLQMHFLLFYIPYIHQKLREKNYAKIQILIGCRQVSKIFSGYGQVLFNICDFLNKMTLSSQMKGEHERTLQRWATPRLTSLWLSFPKNSIKNSKHEPSSQTYRKQFTSPGQLILKPVATERGWVQDQRLSSMKP